MKTGLPTESDPKQQRATKMSQSLIIKEVQRTPRNRRIFRAIARDNSGESLEPAEDEQMFFGYGGGNATEKS